MAKRKAPQAAATNPQPENSSNTHEVWLDKQELLQLMHISERTLQKWRDIKLLIPAKIIGKFYYRLSDVQRLLIEHQKKS